MWSKDYRIYHNLPFLNIFNKDSLLDTSKQPPTPITLSDIEFNRLKKTSVDYTLCDLNDTPLVCIEFDGMQEGFNVGIEYHSRGPSEPARREFTELKLKVAHGSGFPFFVVGTDCFKDLSQDTKLTIVDGIIGEVLAEKAKEKRFSKGFNPSEMGFTKQEFDSLSRQQQYEIFEKWALDVEFISNLESNPIHQKSAELGYEVGEKGYIYTIKFLDSPATHIGVEVSLDPPIPKPIQVKAIIPDFRSPNFSGLWLVQEIAKIIAFDQLNRSLPRYQKNL